MGEITELINRINVLIEDAHSYVLKEDKMPDMNGLPRIAQVGEWLLINHCAECNAETGRLHLDEEEFTKVLHEVWHEIEQGRHHEDFEPVTYVLDTHGEIYEYDKGLCPSCSAENVEYERRFERLIEKRNRRSSWEYDF